MTSKDQPGGLRTPRRAAVYSRVERAFALPMILLALALLVVLLLPVLWPSIPSDVKGALRVADLAIWGAFAVEYVVLLMLAPNKWRYVRTRWPELVLLLVPVLRPLRALQVARVLTAARVFAALGRVVRFSRRKLAISGASYASVLALLVIVIGATMVLQYERRVGDGNIESLGDALWWALTTVTTVGYGDHYPVTESGKLVAAALMIIGVALVSMVTASIAAAFVRWSDRPDDSAGAATAELLREVRALRAEMATLRESRTGDTRAEDSPGPRLSR